jgi:hypothetical protein
MFKGVQRRREEREEMGGRKGTECHDVPSLILGESHP